jgi:hypothetical protein
MQQPVLQTMSHMYACLTSTPGLLVAALAGLVYIGYRALLPKPLPGIPYNAEATRTILGDIPAVMATGAPVQWMREQNAKLNSALVQVWVFPFGRQMLLLSDFQEAQNILLRRTKEFDRDQNTTEAFSGTISHHHAAMFSSDPRFKGNKELVRDLMTPSFLNEVSNS